MQSLRTVATDRHFWPLFITQFLGAFNDNAFKQSLILLITFNTVLYSGQSAGMLTNICALLFILPFFVFSGIAGQWADRFEKSQLTRKLRLAEIALMTCALIGFVSHTLPLLMLTLFGMGAISALFGPIKYAYLPERLSPDALLPANALVETATSLAILIGSLFGGILITFFHDNPWVLGSALIAVATLGWLFACAMPITVAAKPELKTDYHLVRSTRSSLKTLRSHPKRWLLALGISWFWLFGAIWLTQLPQYTARYLGGDASVATGLLVVFSVGIGIGSLLCSALARRLASGNIVLVGGLGMALTSLTLPYGLHDGALLNLNAWLALPGTFIVLIQLMLTGATAGIYLVPLYTEIQLQAEAGERAHVIAGINVLNALFMVCSAIIAALWLGPLNWPLHALLIMLALATAVAAVVWRVPVEANARRL